MKGPLALAATMSLLVVTLALMGVWWRETPSEPPPARPDQPAADRDAGESEFQDYVARGRKLGEEPASWRGTVPDGALREDEHGNLIVSEEVRRRFDYFLSALGEEELNVLRSRVAAHLQAALSATAARQAWALFERYIGYRSALRELDEHDGSVAGMRQSLEERRALRRPVVQRHHPRGVFRVSRPLRGLCLAAPRTVGGRAPRPGRETGPSGCAGGGPAGGHARDGARVAAALGGGRGGAAITRTGRPRRARVYQYREQRLGAEAAERLGELDRRREEWRERYPGVPGAAPRDRGQRPGGGRSGRRDPAPARVAVR